MNKSGGEIHIKADIDIWPHELKTARALATAGYTVTFLKRREGKGERTADIVMEDIIWEMKSPKSAKLKRVERTLRDAIHQSPYVVFDSQRISKLSDSQIQNELDEWARQLRGLKGLLFVTKKRDVIEIK